MISKRQVRLIKELLKCLGKTITLKKLSSIMEVSIRTLQNDIKELNCNDSLNGIIKILTIPSKGIELEILDYDMLELLLIRENNNYNFSSSTNRVNYIITKLIDKSSGISEEEIITELFISHSTFLKDINVVKAKLEYYQLKLKKSKGMFSISGEEKDIRKFINSFIQKNVSTHNHDSYVMPQTKDIVVEALIENEYSISNVGLQNLLVHLNTVVNRLMKGHYIISDTKVEIVDLDDEIRISRSIFSKLKEKIYLNSNENEVTNLAIYLHGKADYRTNIYISEEVDEFVLLSLYEIKKKFGIDMTNNVQLRISLALHIIPLLTRIKFNAQLTNNLLSEIKRNYQLSFDIASSFALSIRKKYFMQMSEDEISFFAIYFNSAINIVRDNSNKKSLLVITDLQRGETLLLQERLSKWFKNKISRIRIVNYLDLKGESLETYDLVCHTDGVEMKNRSSLKISRFPNESDFRNLRIRIDGFKENSEFIELFSKENFFVIDSESKEEILHILCDSLGSYDLDNCLLNEVIARENMGGTYYGNFVAMPHPLHPITSKLKLAVALVAKPVIWDSENNSARIVVLVSMKKNDLKSFQIWSYLSDFINNTSFVESIIKDLSYENFIKQLKTMVNAISWELRD